jgi:hypothetical protein
MLWTIKYWSRSSLIAARICLERLLAISVWSKILWSVAMLLLPNTVYSSRRLSTMCLCTVLVCTNMIELTFKVLDKPHKSTRREIFCSNLDDKNLEVSYSLSTSIHANVGSMANYSSCFTRDLISPSRYVSECRRHRPCRFARSLLSNQEATLQLPTSSIPKPQLPQHRPVDRALLIVRHSRHISGEICMVVASEKWIRVPGDGSRPQTNSPDSSLERVQSWIQTTRGEIQKFSSIRRNLSRLGLIANKILSPLKQ